MLMILFVVSATVEIALVLHRTYARWPDRKCATNRRREIVDNNFVFIEIKGKCIRLERICFCCLCRIIVYTHELNLRTDFRFRFLMFQPFIYV